MHNIKKIGFKIKQALLHNNVDQFGKLLNDHWMEKKRVSSHMSTSNIDKWYEIGMKYGALGGKIMGAGGGGFLLFCVKNGERQNLRYVMEKEGLEYMDFIFDFDVVKVLANI